MISNIWSSHHWGSCRIETAGDNRLGALRYTDSQSFMSRLRPDLLALSIQSSHDIFFYGFPDDRTMIIRCHQGSFLRRLYRIILTFLIWPNTTRGERSGKDEYPDQTCSQPFVNVLTHRQSEPP